MEQTEKETLPNEDLEKEVVVNNFESLNEPLANDEQTYASDSSETLEADNNMEQDSISDYERMRLQNIAEFKAMFKERFGEFPGQSTISDSNFLEEIAPPPVSSIKKRRFSFKPICKMPLRRSLRRNTISNYNELDEDTFSDHRNATKAYDKLSRILNIRYGGDWPRQNFDGELSSDDDDKFFDESSNFFGFKEGFRGFNDLKLNKKRKRERTSLPPTIRLKREIIPPDRISEAALKKICYNSTGKTYDPINGSTCHQCRQKTKDTKTVCRYSECSGVRGQFCGFCLKKRYGEDAAIALKDPNWKCPPCREICNCSICRSRTGRIPTGILAPQAMDRGFESVHHFLDSIEEKKFIIGDLDF